MIDASAKSTTGWTRSRAALVGAVLVVLLPFLVIPLIGLKVENDVETWLPHNDPYARVLQWFHQHFGDETRMLVSWEGSSLNDPRVDRFTTALVGPRDAEGERPGKLEGVAEARSPHDVIFKMLENKIDRDIAVERLVGLVIGPGPLKVTLTDAGRAQSSRVSERLTSALREQIGIDVQVSAAETTAGPQGDGAGAAVTFEGDEFAGPQADDPYPRRPFDLQITWKGQSPNTPISGQVRDVCVNLMEGTTPLVEECFFDPGAPVAVSIRLTPEGDEHVNETLRQIRQAALDAGVPAEALHMGGTPVGRSELNTEAVASIWNTRYPAWNAYKRSPVILSVLVSVLFAFLVLHSVRLAILVLVTSLYAALVATALVPITGTALNMVLVVMPNLLFVLTTSGAIHVANYWQHAAQQNADHPVGRAVKMAMQPCVLAGVTTAIGLASLATSLLLPVRQFGLFSAVGCLLSLVMVLGVFPALMILWSGKPAQAHETNRHRWVSLGHWLSRHSMLVSLSCLLLFVGSGWGLRHFETQTKVIRYFRPTLPIVHDYEYLESQLSGILPLEVVVAFPQSVVAEMNSVERLELIRRVERRLEENPEISGTLSLADFRPEMEPPPRSSSVAVKARYNRTVRGLDEYLASAETETDDGFVVTARTPVNFARGADKVAISQGDEVWRIRAQTAVLSDANYSQMRDDVNRVVDETLATVPGLQHVVTGTVPLFLRTQEAVLESLVLSFGIAFLIIAVVMMVLLRSVAGGLITMLPNLLPVVLVFGLISWAGIKVDIGTMITASVALGIAVDGTLHLITWFRAGLQRGLSRQEAISLALSHCGPAMWQTSAIIGLGMLIVSGSDLLLISRFGWLMAAIIGAALLADIILLPALLAGPLGEVIERKCVAMGPLQDLDPDLNSLPQNTSSIPDSTSAEAVVRKS